MKKDRNHILKTLQEHRDELHAFGVRKLGLFGSFARGEETGASDLDFLVVFEKKTFDAYMGLKIFLEGLFGCPLDLVLKDTLKPRLRKTILDEVVDACEV